MSETATARAADARVLPLPTMLRLDARSPADGRTLLGAPDFLAQQETDHVGRLALRRELVRLPATSYAARQETS